MGATAATRSAIVQATVEGHHRPVRQARGVAGEVSTHRSASTGRAAPRRRPGRGWRRGSVPTSHRTGLPVPCGNTVTKPSSTPSGPSWVMPAWMSAPSASPWKSSTSGSGVPLVRGRRRQQVPPGRRRTSMDDLDQVGLGLGPGAPAAVRRHRRRRPGVRGPAPCGAAPSSPPPASPSPAQAAASTSATAGAAAALRSAPWFPPFRTDLGNRPDRSADLQPPMSECRPQRGCAERPRCRCTPASTLSRPARPTWPT